MAREYQSRANIAIGKKLKLPSGKLMAGICLDMFEDLPDVKTVRYELLANGVCKSAKLGFKNDSFSSDFAVDNLNDQIKATLCFDNGKTWSKLINLKDEAQNIPIFLIENNKGTEKVSALEEGTGPPQKEDVKGKPRRKSKLR
jgi:hypothetical protein